MSIASSTWSNINLIEKKQKVLDGFMFKRGKFNTEYQERWFELYTDNTLAYYQLHGSAPLGVINLYLITNITQEPNTNTFRLITQKRTFILKCNNKQDSDEWFNTIKIRVSPNIIYQGWLHKKGEKNKSWKKRYFLLCNYELRYELRYYEDNKYQKYKGHLNCNDIDDIQLLYDKSIKKHGKNNVLEMTTVYRTYIVAGNDINTIDLWYQSLKSVVFGDFFEKKDTEIIYNRIISNVDLTESRKNAIKESPINEWDSETVLIWFDSLNIDDEMRTNLKRVTIIKNINGYNLDETRNPNQMQNLFKLQNQDGVNHDIAIYLYNEVHKVRSAYVQSVASKIESDLFGGDIFSIKPKKQNILTQASNYRQTQICVQCNDIISVGAIFENNGYYCQRCWDLMHKDNKTEEYDDVYVLQSSRGDINDALFEITSLKEQIKKLNETLNTKISALNREKVKTNDLENKMEDLKRNNNNMRNELNATKQSLRNEQTKTKQLQKQLKELSVSSFRKIHKKGNKTEWKRKKIDKWNTNDILHWINTLNLDNKWNNKLLDEIENCGCNGKDITLLKSVQEIGDSFDINDNKTLCNTLFKKIKKIKKQQNGNAPSSPKRKTKSNKFRINIFSQNRYITLDEKVTKSTRVNYVKKLYKKQSGVSAEIGDIHFYTHLKLLNDSRTLAQIGIVDDKHLITVKFGAESADKNASFGSGPKCACGRFLQKVLASDCYGGSSVLCNLCYDGIEAHEFVYHCGAKKITAHDNGYDLCLKCSAKSSTTNKKDLVFDTLFSDNANNDNFWGDF